MNLSHEEEENSLSLSKFESMLKTNKVFFFDSEEFEDIILHYMDTGRLNLAKKALKLGLEQHPKSTGLKLVQVEMLVYEDKLDIAEKLLNELYAIEPTNEEIYIQKANIHSKRDEHEKAISYLEIALKYTDDYADVYSMIGMEYLFMDNLEMAKENFIKCLDEDTEDYSALYNVVYCFDFLDQNEEAIVYLNRFIDKNPYSEVAWHQLGRQYYASHYSRRLSKILHFLLYEQFFGQSTQSLFWAFLWQYQKETPRSWMCLHLCRVSLRLGSGFRGCLLILKTHWPQLSGQSWHLSNPFRSSPAKNTDLGLS